MSHPSPTEAAAGQTRCSHWDARVVPRPAPAPGWPGGLPGEAVCRTCLASAQVALGGRNLEAHSREFKLLATGPRG